MNPPTKNHVTLTVEQRRSGGGRVEAGPRLESMPAAVAECTLMTCFVGPRCSGRARLGPEHIGFGCHSDEEGAVMGDQGIIPHGPDASRSW